jgi:enamine deaminase RidA (YjgF/YER057c/UK114 family)
MNIKRHECGPRLSQAVVHGETVYLSGQVGNGATAAEQMRSALASAEALLVAVGSDKSKVLRAILWLADIRDIGEVNEVWDAWVMPGHSPARATSEARLVSPEFKVEVTITAAL